MSNQNRLPSRQDIPRPPTPTERDWQIEAARKRAEAIPRPQTPTELDWQLAAAYRSGSSSSNSNGNNSNNNSTSGNPYNIPFPPLVPHPSTNQQQRHVHFPTTPNQQSPNPGQSPFFTSPSTHQQMYRNMSPTEFPVAGQQRDGKIVDNSRFEAKTEMKGDGVQHYVFSGWQNRGESGVNSSSKEWFEKR